MSGRKKEGILGGISGGGFFFGQIESLISGERRRFMKKVLVLFWERVGGRRPGGGSWTERSLHLGKSMGVKS